MTDASNFFFFLFFFLVEMIYDIQPELYSYYKTLVSNQCREKYHTALIKYFIKKTTILYNMYYILWCRKKIYGSMTNDFSSKITKNKKNKQINKQTKNRRVHLVFCVEKCT